MKTRFIEAQLDVPHEAEVKSKTVFTHVLEEDLSVRKASRQAMRWDNVAFLFEYPNGECLFAAWDDDSPSHKALYIGTKGDEF